MICLLSGVSCVVLIVWLITATKRCFYVVQILGGILLMASGGNRASPVSTPYCYECAKLGRVCLKSREELEKQLTGGTARSGNVKNGVCECKHAVSDHRT